MKRRGRDVHGIVLLDKPVGITSNAALQTVKRLYQARKAGHTGSLDPLAGGLLPLCLGEATKLSTFLLDSDKRYIAQCRLGVTTSTSDAEGEVLETRPVENLSTARIEQVLAAFTGDIEQVPPMHSALKFHGQPLYKLAQRGVTVERAARRVHIYALRLLHYAGDTLDIEVHCSKGTYIRTLVEDIGARLGCGAHLAALKRTAVGGFDAARMVTLEQLRALAEQGLEHLDSVIIPMQAALNGFPDVRLSADAAFYLRRGQAVFVPRTAHTGWVKLFADDNRFLGVGQVLEDGRVAPKRLVMGNE